MIEFVSDPGNILKTARSFFSSRLILTAANLRIFDRLPATTAELSESCGWNAGTLAIFMDALTALGLLEKKSEIYGIAPGLAEALGRDPEKSILPMLEHFHGLWEKWSRLEDIVKNGREGIESLPMSGNEDEIRSFIGAMHVVGRDMAAEVVPELNPAWAKRLLDVGGASGTYTIEFLKAVPGLKATLFDRPNVILMAAERLEWHGLSERVTLAGGDFYKDEMPGGHDLVWLSAIIHQNSRAQNRELFAKCHAALVPGGRIWIRDHIMDETRTRPAGGAIFAVNMLAATPGGSTYTLAEVTEDLEKCGFTGVRLIREGENMDAVVEAVK